MRVGQLSVATKVDDSGFRAGVDSLHRQSGALSNVLTGIFQGIGQELARPVIHAVENLGASLIETAKDAAGSTMRYHELASVLGIIGTNAGYTQGQLDKYVASLRGVNIEGDVAYAVLSDLIRSNIDLADATKLAKVAQDAAVLSGEDSSETLQNLIYGIQTQNTEILRTHGIYVNVGGAIDAYAAKLHKSAKDLTESQRQQAVFNAVLESGKSIAGSYSGAMKEPGKVLRSMQRIGSDLGANLGEVFYPLLQKIVPQIYQFGQNLIAWSGPGGAGGEMIKSLGQKLADFAGRLGSVFDFITEHQDIFKAAAIGIAAIGTALLVSMVPGMVAAAAAAIALAIPLLPLYALILGIGVLVGLLAYAWIHNFGDIQGKTQAVMDAVMPPLNALWNWLSVVIPPALATVGRIFGAVFSAIGTFVYNNAVFVATSIGVIRNAFVSVIGFVRDLPGKITKAIGDLAKLLYSTGTDLIQGFLNGISAKWKDLIAWLYGKLHDLPKPIQDALGISSPSKVMFGLGLQITEGLRLGMRSGYDQLLGDWSGMQAKLSGLAVGSPVSALAAQISRAAAGVGGGPSLLPAGAAAGYGAAAGSPAAVVTVPVEIPLVLDGHELTRIISQIQVDMIRRRTGLKI